MVENDHNFFKDNLSAYALGALDPDEARQLEAHLEGCKTCRAELAEFSQVSEGLLAAVPPVAPPPELRERLAARLPGAAPARSRAVKHSPRFSFAYAAAFTLVLLLLGLNLFSYLQVRELQRQQSEMARLLQDEQSAVAMLAYPDSRKIPIAEGAAGSLLINGNGSAAILFAWDLQELPSGQTYQVWLIDARGNRVSGGLFVVSAGSEYTSVQVDSPGSLDEFTGLGVTIEPAGGSPGPTGQNVLKVDF